MPSISEIHRATVLEHVAKSLYATGTRPSTSTIIHHLSRYFRDNPPGTPLKPRQGTNAPHLRSDPRAANESMANVLANLSMLFQASQSQGAEIMDINTILRTYLDKLVVKRKKLTTQLDDYLLSLYNTDGYYYSISDGFSDLKKTDISKSNAYVDVTSGKVSLPITKSLSVDMSSSDIPRYEVKAYVTAAVDDITAVDSQTDLTSAQFTTISGLENAFDGMSNTVWAIELEREKKSEVLVDLTITLDTLARDLDVSRVEIDTYGIVPVQIYVEALNDKGEVESFGESVITTDTRAAFIDNTKSISSLRIRFRKTEPDYTVTKNGKTRYKYLFGAKEIYVTKNIYDNAATFVSEPLSIDEPFTAFIDAVSLHVEDQIPEDTAIQYYVAKDDPEAETAEDFDWKPIVPVQEQTDENKIVRFNSSTLISNFIRHSPTDSEFQLIGPDTTNADLKKRNPSPSILTNGNVYRVAEVGDEFISETMTLEEGYNTVRILYKNYKKDNYLTLDNWQNAIKGTETVNEAYARIDNGQGYFSGLTVGESYKSYYIETYLESSEDRQTLVRECIKTSSSSRVWDVKIFLNGEEIADLPEGVDSLPVTWKINKGLNHIALLVDIPAGTDSIPRPDWGVFELMKDDYIYNYGTVRLNKWSYVDEFALNEDTTTIAKPNETVRFSVVNGEIVSRIKPTDNFRIRYAKSNQQAPDAVRVKAELSRGSEDPHVTPSIDLYRLRFSHGD